MIKQVLLTISLLFAIESNSQEYVYNFVQGSILNYQPVSLNQHQFRFQTSILDYFVPTFSSTTEIIGDVLEVKMYYDITEQVFSFGNLITYNNLVDYNQLIASNVTQIKMSTNVIMIEDNPPYNPIAVDNLYFRIFDLENLSINANSELISTIFPNPTTGSFTINSPIKINTIELYDIVGKQVMSLTSNKNTERIQLINSPAGVYFIKLTSDNGSVVKKLIVQ
jgi:hypothetical protein